MELIFRLFLARGESPCGLHRRRKQYRTGAAKAKAHSPSLAVHRDIASAAVPTHHLKVPHESAARHWRGCGEADLPSAATTSRSTPSSRSTSAQNSLLCSRSGARAIPSFELRVAIVQQKSPILQESPTFRGHVASYLPHPGGIRVFGDSRNRDMTRPERKRNACATPSHATAGLAKHLSPWRPLFG